MADNMKLNNTDNNLNEDDLEKVSSGTSALNRYYYKCTNSNCRSFNRKVAVMLPRLDVKVKCKRCNYEMERLNN